MVFAARIRSASLYLPFHHMGSHSRTYALSDWMSWPVLLACTAIDAIGALLCFDSSLVFFKQDIQHSARLSNVSVPTATVYLIYHAFHLVFCRSVLHIGQDGAVFCVIGIRSSHSGLYWTSQRSL